MACSIAPTHADANDGDNASGNKKPNSGDSGGDIANSDEACRKCDRSSHSDCANECDGFIVVLRKTGNGTNRVTDSYRNSDGDGGGDSPGNDDSARASDRENQPRVSFPSIGFCRAQH